MHIRWIFRWALTAAAALLSVIISLNIEVVARAIGIDTALRDALLSEEKSWLLDMIASQWTGYIAIFVIAMAIGVWLDSLLSNIDSKKPTRSTRLINLGWDCESMANSLEKRIASTYPAKPNFENLAIETRSLSLTLRKNGLSVPRLERPFSEYNVHGIAYGFRLVGTLLQHGHFKEARKAARAFSAAPIQAEPKEIDELAAGGT